MSKKPISLFVWYVVGSSVIVPFFLFWNFEKGWFEKCKKALTTQRSSTQSITSIPRSRGVALRAAFRGRAQLLKNMKHWIRCRSSMWGSKIMWADFFKILCGIVRNILRLSWAELYHVFRAYCNDQFWRRPPKLAFVSTRPRSCRHPHYVCSCHSKGDRRADLVQWGERAMRRVALQADASGHTNKGRQTKESQSSPAIPKGSITAVQAKQADTLQHNTVYEGITFGKVYKLRSSVYPFDL